jgi:glyoxylase I family protein
VRGVDHFDLVVSDLDRSLDFYRGLLRPLGWTGESEIKGERGERVVYLNRRDGRTSISLRAAQSPTGYDRYAVGIHHIALAARSRTQVDERTAWVKANGATIEDEPREWHYTPGYYASFFRDPDGIKLEIVHRPLLRTIAWLLRGKPRD